MRAVGSYTHDIDKKYAVQLFPSSYFVTNKPLWKNEANKVHNLIMGIIACMKEGINITKFDSQELKEKVEKIGMVSVT